MNKEQVIQVLEGYIDSEKLTLTPDGFTDVAIMSAYQERNANVMKAIELLIRLCKYETNNG